MDTELWWLIIVWGILMIFFISALVIFMIKDRKERRKVNKAVSDFWEVVDKRLK